VSGAPNQRFLDWITSYEGAWRTPGTALLQELFAADATYQAAPFDDPISGLERIAAFWEAERDTADEAFTLQASIIAAGTETAVARIEVVYGDPALRTYRDLWIITLDQRGLCTAFEEWPFFPEQPRAIPR
jgi:hypothetical protein